MGLINLCDTLFRGLASRWNVLNLGEIYYNSSILDDSPERCV